MRHLSVRGVLRVYGGPFIQNTQTPSGAPQPQDIHDGKFSLARVIRFSGRSFQGVSSSPLKLLSELTWMASDGRSFPLSECVFGWVAAYAQVWTHIVLGIELQ